MSAVDGRAYLQTRKDDVVAAIRALERDRADGVVDELAYDAALRRYEIEAAELLERLDRLTPPPPRDIAGVRRRTLALGAGALIVAAIAILLVAALHDRSTTGTVTGDAPPVVVTPAPASSPAVLAAERQVSAHPRSVTALLALGNAYLQSGDPQSADRAFVRAMRIAPGRPEPPTFHALVLGASPPKLPQALAILAGVERSHPSYTRAWLVDGLLSARRKVTYHRAIRAYRRFLALVPRSSISAEVRQLLAGLERAAR